MGAVGLWSRVERLNSRSCEWSCGCVYLVAALREQREATGCGEMSELAEGARLEIVYTPKGYPGFKSPSLRHLATFGEVAERLNAAVSKTVLPVTPVTRVRIPASPPFEINVPAGTFFRSRSWCMDSNR